MYSVEFLQPLQGLFAQNAAQSMQKDTLTFASEHGHRERCDQIDRVESNPIGRVGFELDRFGWASFANDAQWFTKSFVSLSGTLWCFYRSCNSIIIKILIKTFSTLFFVFCFNLPYLITIFFNYFCHKTKVFQTLIKNKKVTSWQALNLSYTVNLNSEDVFNFLRVYGIQLRGFMYMGNVKITEQFWISSIKNMKNIKYN